MDVSIIIVNYNTSGLIADCVESIMKFTEGITYEVIIVDNNSEKEFQSIISKKIPKDRLEIFKFLALPENIGFGRANNEGVKIASGKKIFYLNPDTALLNNAIKILSDFLDSNPKAGACGANLYDANLRPNYSHKRMAPGILWEINELLNTKPQKILYGKNFFFNHTSKPMEVAFITGADLMVRKEIIDGNGGFRKEYFMYYEETDLCFRIRKTGWKIYNVPEARIMHLEGSSSFGEAGKFGSENKIKYLEISRNIYYNLNTNKLIKSLSNFLYGIFLHSRKALIKDEAKKEYYDKRIKYYNGK